MQVDTVRGPVDVDELGVTLMHEHLFLLWHDLIVNHPGAWDEDTAVAEAIEKANALYDLGCRTFVDLTVLGLGRSIPLIKRVAEETPLNIVVATGFYTFNDLPPYLYGMEDPSVNGYLPRLAPPDDGPDPIVEMFVRDVEVGIGETGVRAAILKCATERFGVTPGVDRILRAVARAHRRTGVPISTHTSAQCRVGLDQQRVFREEGVDLSRVIIGHSGDTRDVACLEELIANGSYLGMDRFGMDFAASFEDRIWVVAEMCRRGHADRMVLSHDSCCIVQGAERHDLSHVAPRWNWTHLFLDVVPALREAGVTDDQLDQMLVRNPAAIFSRRDPY